MATKLSHAEAESLGLIKKVSTEDARKIGLIQDTPHESKEAEAMDPASAELQGAKPAIADYAPMLRRVSPSAAVDDLNSAPIQGILKMSPEAQKSFGESLDRMDPSIRKHVVHGLIQGDIDRDIQKNKDTRSKAQKDQPGAYSLGKIETAAMAGPALGAIAGPEAAAQGMAGAALGGAQDASPEGMVLGGAGQYGASKMLSGAARPIKAGLSRLSEGVGDGALAKYMGIDPATIARLEAANGGAVADHVGPDLKEVTGAVRANSDFPWANPQGTLNNLQRNAMQTGARGTIGSEVGDAAGPVPMGQVKAEMSSMPVPQGRPPIQGPVQGRGQVDMQEGGKYPGKYGDWYDSSSSELSKLMSPEPPNGRDPISLRNAPNDKSVSLDMYHGYDPAEAPPVDPATRMASQGMAHAASKAQGGLPTQTMAGGMAQAFMNKAVPMTTIGIPKTAAKMLQILENKAVGGGIKGTSAAAVRRLIQQVQDSPDPSFTDYLAKETDPEYLALSLAAEKEKDNE